MQAPINSHTELFRLSGDVDNQYFLDWICHRANRLGLTGWVRKNADSNSIEVMARGPAELLDAMELGCSLGPISVWVEQIERFPHKIEGHVPNGFNILPALD